MRLKKLATLILFAVTAGCATLYDNSFLDSTPPVYFNAVLGPEEKLSSVEVLSVIPESPAAKAGFRKGDLILYINGEEVRHSARELYKILMDACEKRISDVRSVIKRKGTVKRIDMAPADPFLKGLYGLNFKLTRESGKELKAFSFVKQYVTDDGLQYDAVYNVAGKMRLRTNCHLWGGKLLVIQFDVFNDSTEKNLHVDPKDVTVSDRWGRTLEPLSTEEIVSGIYNVGRINEIKGKWFYLQGRKAQHLSAELNGLHWELNTHRFKPGEIPPLNVGYGSLIYLLSPGHSPVTVRVKAGQRYFLSQYVMPQIETAPGKPANIAEGQERGLTSRKEYASFLDFLREKRWLF